MAHNTDAIRTEKKPGKILNDFSAFKGLIRMGKLNYLPAKPAGSSTELDRIVLGGSVLIQKILISLDSVLTFGGSGLAAPLDPFPLCP